MWVRACARARVCCMFLRLERLFQVRFNHPSTDSASWPKWLAATQLSLSRIGWGRNPAWLRSRIPDENENMGNQRSGPLPNDCNCNDRGYGNTKEATSDDQGRICGVANTQLSIECRRRLLLLTGGVLRQRNPSTEPTQEW